MVRWSNAQLGKTINAQLRMLGREKASLQGGLAGCHRKCGLAQPGKCPNAKMSKCCFPCERPSRALTKHCCRGRQLAPERFMVKWGNALLGKSIIAQVPIRVREKSLALWPGQLSHQIRTCPDVELP